MILKSAKRGLRDREVPIDYHAARRRVEAATLCATAGASLRFLLLHSSTYLFLIPGTVLLVLGLLVVIPLCDRADRAVRAGPGTSTR